MYGNSVTIFFDKPWAVASLGFNAVGWLGRDSLSAMILLTQQNITYNWKYTTNTNQEQILTANLDNWKKY